MGVTFFVHISDLANAQFPKEHPSSSMSLSRVCHTQLSCPSDACTEIKLRDKKLWILCSVFHDFNCRGGGNQWVYDLILGIKFRVRTPGLDFKDLETWKAALIRMTNTLRTPNLFDTSPCPVERMWSSSLSLLQELLIFVVYEYSLKWNFIKFKYKFLWHGSTNIGSNNNQGTTLSCCSNNYFSRFVLWERTEEREEYQTTICFPILHTV